MNCQLILKELCSFFHKFVDRWLTSKTIPRKVDALISVIPYRWKNMRALCGVGVEEKNRSHLRYGSLMASNAKYARRVCIKQIPTHFDGSFRTKWNPPPSFYAISRGKRHWHLLAEKNPYFKICFDYTRFAFVCRSGSKKHSQECVILIINDLFHGILLLWVNTSGRTSVCKQGFYFGHF